MSHTISFNENHRLSLRIDEILSIIPTFSTKKAAIESGAKYGWRSALRVERRFETVWVIGKKDLQNDNVSGLVFEGFHFPLLKWEKTDGATCCPVLSVRRFKEVK